MSPKRIQRKNTKGWRMPEGAVSVVRASRWGNPFKVHGGSVVGLPWFEMKALPLAAGVRAAERDVLCQSHGPAAGALPAAVEAFAGYCDVMLRDHHLEFAAWLHPLRGKVLACWCPLDQPCHADVLLEIANQDQPPLSPERG